LGIGEEWEGLDDPFLNTCFVKKSRIPQNRHRLVHSINAMLNPARIEASFTNTIIMGNLLLRVVGFV
jgi:hypothetical protein